jgi:hypothetical protein
VFYFGYDNTGKHYSVHLMTVWGADSDSLGVGERKGNEVKIVFRTAMTPSLIGSSGNRIRRGGTSSCRTASPKGRLMSIWRRRVLERTRRSLSNADVGSFGGAVQLRAA